MVSIIIRNHASELLVSAGITIDNANEMYEVYEELPGAKCFWEGIDYDPNVYEFDYPFVTWNYVGTRDIWLITSTKTIVTKRWRIGRLTITPGKSPTDVLIMICTMMPAEVSHQVQKTSARLLSG